MGRKMLMRVLGFVGLLLVASGLQAQEIEFTRYLSDLTDAQGEFFANEGSGQLVVTLPQDKAADAPFQIVLNSTAVYPAAGQRTDSDLSTRLTVGLAAENSIKILNPQGQTLAGTVRITQVADVTLHVGARVHFNTNVSDFTAAREFYGKLGFNTLSGFPDTNTNAMARAIGIYQPTSYDGSQGDDAGGYLLHGELIGVGGYQGGLIDLIEFKIPKNSEPPFQTLNRLGMVSAVMLTADLTADFAYLTEQGVKFVAPPTQRADGSQFAVFTDLDGTFYELVEEPGAESSSGPSQIVGLGALVINVSDFDRSLAWYQMLGYELVKMLPATQSLEVAQAMGFEQVFEIKGGVLKHPEDGSLVRLVQWLQPYDSRPPYPLPVNHLGIHRTAFYTSDIAADVAMLKSQGVAFVSEVTPCCSGDDSPGSIVAFFDPDGTVVELVEQPFMMEGLSVLGWFRETFLNW